MKYIAVLCQDDIIANDRLAQLLDSDTLEDALEESGVIVEAMYPIINNALIYEVLPIHVAKVTYEE